MLLSVSDTAQGCGCGVDVALGEASALMLPLDVGTAVGLKPISSTVIEMARTTAAILASHKKYYVHLKGD